MISSDLCTDKNFSETLLLARNSQMLKAFLSNFDAFKNNQMWKTICKMCIGCCNSFILFDVNK